jgi:hypothetical protein
MQANLPKPVKPAQNTPPVQPTAPKAHDRSEVGADKEEGAARDRFDRRGKDKADEATKPKPAPSALDTPAEGEAGKRGPDAERPDEAGRPTGGRRKSPRDEEAAPEPEVKRPEPQPEKVIVPPPVL